MRAFLEKICNRRNTPFWHKQKAKKLLLKDVKDGVDKSMTPKELWLKRKEYQEFPLQSFCKCIYKVRSKKLAGPYWQAKPNKNAMK